MATKTLHTDKPTLAGRVPFVGSESKFNVVAVPRLSLDELEFMRLPSAKRGRDQLSGLSRSALIDLGVTVPGLLVRLRKPGAVRGAVLVHVPTLRQYLRDMREAQIKQEGQAQ